MNNFVDLLALSRLLTKFDLLPTTKFALATTLCCYMHPEQQLNKSFLSLILIMSGTMTCLGKNKDPNNTYIHTYIHTYQHLYETHFPKGYKAPTEDTTKKSKLKMFQCKVE